MGIPLRLKAQKGCRWFRLGCWFHVRVLRPLVNSVRFSPVSARLKTLDRQLVKLEAEVLASPPIFVFQMGKVGSCSLVETLSQAWPGRIVHAHALSGMAPEDQASLKLRQRFRLPIFVISPIRDPLSRNVSAFFQNFERDAGVPFAARRWTLVELRRLFLHNYPHHTCLEWFEGHFRPAFGIDVYATEFPRDQGWQVYHRNSVKALIYRTDLDHAQQLAILSDFLSLKLERWVLANQSAAKPYAAVYSEFCAKVSLPSIYCGVLGSSRFVRHFWPEESIAHFTAKWSRPWGQRPVFNINGAGVPTSGLLALSS